MSVVKEKKVQFLGVPIEALDSRGILKRILRYASNAESHTIMYVNVDCIRIAQMDEAYRRILNRAQLVYADGVGIVIGARLFGYQLPGRSTGADILPNFCRSFAAEGVSMFFLGARPGVAQKAADKLKERNPGLVIAGTHHGYFQEHENESIISQINRARPRILVVGMGAPGQEKWIDKHLDRLDVPVVWGVGGAFDFISGLTNRGPQWLFDNGFEWLCRLCVEPKRLWKRYLIGNLHFGWLLIQSRFSHKNRVTHGRN